MPRSGKYLVQVFDRQTAKVVDRTTVPFGEFKEIGFWLDNFGYNDSRYSVSIHFTEE